MLNYEALIADRIIGEKSSRAPILIVEDDQSLRKIFEWSIRDINPELKFQWCASYEQAWDAISENPYKLVISDFLLRGCGNGLDVWEFSNRMLPRAKFVMMSSLNLKDFCQISAPKGREPALLAKPLDINKMRSLIVAATEV